jgi:hypothetical protein
MPSVRAACESSDAWVVDRPYYLAWDDDGDGCGCLERPCPGGVFPALFVGVGELLGVGVGVGDRCRDVDGEGDGFPDPAGADDEDEPGGRLLEPPGAGWPAPPWPPCPVVRC